MSEIEIGYKLAVLELKMTEIETRVLNILTYLESQKTKEKHEEVENVTRR
jgi:hypothetical protein